MTQALWQALESFKETRHLSEFSGQIALVDTLNFLQKDPIYLKIDWRNDPLQQRKRIREMLCNLIDLLNEYSIAVQFYFDGFNVYQGYGQRGLHHFEDVNKEDPHGIVLFDEAYKVLRRQGHQPKLVFYEADYQIAFQHRAYLKQNRKSFAISNDSDFFILGVPRVDKIVIDHHKWRLDTFGRCYYYFVPEYPFKLIDDFSKKLKAISHNKIKLAYLSAFNALGNPNAKSFKKINFHYDKQCEQLRMKISLEYIVDLIFFNKDLHSRHIINQLRIQPQLLAVMPKNYEHLFDFQVVYILSATIFDGEKPQFLDPHHASCFIKAYNMTKIGLTQYVGPLQNLQEVIIRYKFFQKSSEQPQRINANQIKEIVKHQRQLYLGEKMGKIPLSMIHEQTEEQSLQQNRQLKQY